MEKDKELSLAEKTALADLLQEQTDREPLSVVIKDMNATGMILWTILRNRNTVVPVFSSDKAVVCDCLHVTYLYGKRFISDVLQDVRMYRPLCLFIHSIVPPEIIAGIEAATQGDSRLYGNVVYFPLIIKPPYLENYMLSATNAIYCNERVYSMVERYLQISKINTGRGQLKEVAWGAIIYILRKTYEWKLLNLVESIAESEKVNPAAFYTDFTRLVNGGLVGAGELDLICTSSGHPEEIYYQDIKVVIDILKERKTTETAKHLSYIRDIERELMRELYP